VADHLTQIPSIPCLILIYAVAALGLPTGCGDGGLHSPERDGSLPPAGPEVQVGAARDADRMGEPLRLDGSPDRPLGTDAGVDRLSGPDADGSAPFEVAPGAVIDGLPPHSEWAHADVGNESGAGAGGSHDANFGLEAGAEVGRPGCPNGSSLPRSVTGLDEGALPSAFTIVGDTAFIGTMSQPSAQTAPTGTLVTISLASGAVTKFPLGATIPEQLVAGPGAIFFTPGKLVADNPGAWRFDYNDVARFDLATRKVSIVDTSPVVSTFGIFSLTGGPAGDVFWTVVLDTRGPSAVRRWNDVAGIAETILTWGQPVPLVADGDRVYWFETTSSLHVVFRSMPVSGGAVAQLYESPATFPDTPSLAAVDDESLYYLFADGEGQGVWAMPKGGGDGRLIVAKVLPVVLLIPPSGDSYIYWVDQSDQETIRRAPKAGGGVVEILWSGKNPTSLAIDDCNLYWIAGYPSQLYARAR
jgi:hypothetical protein